MRQQWHVQTTDSSLAQALSGALGIDVLTAHCLINRGIKTPTEAACFLNPSDHRDLAQFGPMVHLIGRLRQAIAEREPILVFGDSDVDGLTASVILYEAIERLGGVVRAVQSNRIEDGYGIPDDLIDEVCASSCRLVILVDCGTNQPEPVRRLQAQGIDVLIVDHHVPLEGHAQPRVMLNPFCEPETQWRELCSAGLAFQVASALLENQDEADLSFADLAALGTLADYSPIRGENRRILALGLPQISATRRSGLRKLCADTEVTEATPDQLIKRLIPRLNASGRLGDASAIWHLLRTNDDGHDAFMVKASEAHVATKQMHRQIIAQAQEQVNRLHFKDQYVLVVARTGWHQGLMGPLAAQLSQQYGRPAIAIAMDEEEGTGSGRSIPMVNLLNVLKECQDVLVRFGGHSQACGLTVSRKHLDAFRALVNQHAKSSVGGEGLGVTRHIDLELTLPEITQQWVLELERMAPFGQGNPKPSVLIRNVEIEPQSARIAILRDGAEQIMLRGMLPAVAAGERYDVVASPLVMNQELRLQLIDAQRCEAL